jgi:hypothetical protein
MSDTWVSAQIHLQEFDELFIKQCAKLGLTAEQSKRELLENPARKAMVDFMVKSEQIKAERTMVLLKNKHT